MRYTKVLLIVLLCTAVLLLITGCEQPEYYHPYGEGVDPDSVTTGTFLSRTTTSRTTSPTQSTTTIAPNNSDVVVPEGYRICPECQGVKVVCEKCDGTGEVLGQSYDPEVFTDYYEPCENCSSEDPGYYFCDACRNELVVSE